MRVNTVVRASTLALVVAGTSMLAAPEQTALPGQMTQARVWVQNRNRAEAIPVDLREVNLDAPLKVVVTNGDPASRSSPVPVTEVRKVWEYETVTLPSPEDVAAVLNGRGTSGWETTGIAFTAQDGRTTLLLKRPR
jgi:hypothetical protein